MQEVWFTEIFRIFLINQQQNTPSLPDKADRILHSQTFYTATVSGYVAQKISLPTVWE